MKKLQIILDPAHGDNTLGKRSPDGKHREYFWSRERCKSLAKKLESIGLKVVFTNQLNREIGLSTRKKVAMELANKFVGESLLISLHNNAASNAKEWTTATGYSVYTSPGQTKSDKFAEILLLQLKEDFPEFRMREDRYSDGDLDKEAHFTVLMGKGYSAVLVEWLFQDNKEDLQFIDDPEYNEEFENSIIKALETWISI